MRYIHNFFIVWMFYFLMKLEEVGNLNLTQPLIMCKSKYDWTYRGILPEGNCGHCSHDEGNFSCINYDPIEIFDFERIKFMCDVDRYNGRN